MDPFIAVLTELGFAISLCLVCGYFIFITMKFILKEVKNSVLEMAGIIIQLEQRISLMNNDIIRLDVLVSPLLGISPDIKKIARFTYKDEERRD